MSKFTARPWHVELGEIHEVRDAEGGRICILTQLRGRHGLGGRRDDIESPANAHLIAAAPELYEALTWIKREAENFPGRENCRCFICEALPLVCGKALTKADGQ